MTETRRSTGGPGILRTGPLRRFCPAAGDDKTGQFSHICGEFNLAYRREDGPFGQMVTLRIFKQILSGALCHGDPYFGLGFV
jgi:hypothetical protein